MIRHTRFNYCPACAASAIEVTHENGIRCRACGYVYFHNMAAAVAGIVEADGKIVLIRRGHEPRKGLYVLPGGFVDYHESLEEALVREVKEELSIDICDIRYFGSAPNRYEYEGVSYFTADAFFLCRAVDIKKMKISDENTGLLVVDPQEIDLESLAFSTMKEMVGRYRQAVAGWSL